MIWVKLMHLDIELYQWPFQEPKLEVPTIYKAYIRPHVREYPHKIWPKIWY
jgi:hypothetical protein